MTNRPCFVVRIFNLWVVVGLISPQIEIKASVWFKAGVKNYKLTYYTPKYDIKPMLTIFWVTPQLGVPPEEARVTVDAKSSIGTWEKLIQ